MSADLAARSLEVSDPTASAVLDAHSMIAADPEIADQIDDMIHDRVSAPHAVHQAFEGYREMLSEAGGYLASEPPT